MWGLLNLVVVVGLGTLTLWQTSLQFCSIVYYLCLVGDTLFWLHAVLFLIFFNVVIHLLHPDQLGQGLILIRGLKWHVSVVGQALRPLCLLPHCCFSPALKPILLIGAVPLGWAMAHRQHRQSWLTSKDVQVYMQPVLAQVISWDGRIVCFRNITKPELYDI